MHPYTDPVVLDGRTVCTWSEEWRHECEIRYALKLPDKARKPRITKLDYLNGVEKERGSEARFKLRQDMLRRYKNGSSK
jgi:hypothetical protein